MQVDEAKLLFIRDFKNETITSEQLKLCIDKVEKMATEYLDMYQMFLTHCKNYNIDTQDELEFLINNGIWVHDCWRN